MEYDDYGLLLDPELDSVVKVDSGYIQRYLKKREKTSTHGSSVLSATMSTTVCTEFNMSHIIIFVTSLLYLSTYCYY